MRVEAVAVEQADFRDACFRDQVQDVRPRTADADDGDALALQLFVVGADVNAARSRVDVVEDVVIVFIGGINGVGLRGDLRPQLSRLANDLAEITEHLVFVVAIIVACRKREVRLHAAAEILRVAQILEAAQLSAISMAGMFASPVRDVMLGLSRLLVPFGHLRIELGDQNAIFAHCRRRRDVGNVLDQQVAVADFEVVPVVPHSEEVGTTSD